MPQIFMNNVTEKAIDTAVFTNPIEIRVSIMVPSMVASCPPFSFTSAIVSFFYILKLQCVG